MMPLCYAGENPVFPQTKLFKQGIIHV